MNFFQAIILGLIQGLTEFLPVSSSGHLALGEKVLGLNFQGDLLFIITVHFATTLSIFIVFRKDIWEIIQGLLKFKWNKETKFAFLLVISAIPVVVLGLVLGDKAEELFKDNMLFLGICFIITGALLFFSHFYKPTNKRELNIFTSFAIGIAQAIAVLPAISRSGATISTGLALGINKAKVARFSFLMSIIPILGATFLQILDLKDSNNLSVEPIPLIVGFIAAFISGTFACAFMINIIKKQKLYYFGGYCVVVGVLSILLAVSS